MKIGEKTGLKSVREARERRSLDQSLARPMGMIHVLRSSERVSMRTRLLVLSGVVASLALYWIISDRQLDAAKQQLLSRQRAAQQSLGSEWNPMRDRVEALVLEATKPFPGETVSERARSWDFRSLPGIYLRLRLEDARASESLREAALTSVQDGFTGCLLRDSAKCAASADLADGGAFNDQPWNLREAYRATRVLEEPWVATVKSADGDLRLRIFEQQFNAAIEHEIPVAAQIVKRAAFFLLVLDEDSDEARAHGDGGVIDAEALQQVAHPTRIILYDLKKDELAFRLRRSAAAAFRFAGERRVTDPGVLAAMQRQVNNCALANETWDAVHADGG